MKVAMLLPGLAFLAFATGIARPDAPPPADARGPEAPQAAAAKELRVRPTADFELTGDGSADAWRQAEWVPLSRRDPDGLAYETRGKLLHPPKGPYLLVGAEDPELTAANPGGFPDPLAEGGFE